MCIFFPSQTNHRQNSFPFSVFRYFDMSLQNMLIMCIFLVSPNSQTHKYMHKYTHPEFIVISQVLIFQSKLENEHKQGHA